MFEALRVPAIAVARRLMVREHELGQTGYFVSLFFLVGVGIAIGRGTSYALFFKHYGIEYLPLTYLALGPALMATSFVYAAYSDRMAPENMFRVLSASLAAILVVIWFLLAFGTVAVIYPVYFLVFEVASEVLLMHFALYMGQNFDVLQAKRLSPLVFAGLQTGIIAGGILLVYGATTVGAKPMVLGWCLVLLATIPLTIRYHRRAGSSFCHGRRPGPGGGGAVSRTQLVTGLKFAKNSELVRMIAMALFFMVTSYYVLSYAVNLVYAETYEDADRLSGFFGALSALTSVIALVIQLFLTNRIIHWLGVARANLIYPLTTLASFAVLLASFSFPAAIVGSINRESLLTAVRNPVRNLFFGALPAHVQGRARALCAALVLPVALAFTGGMLLLAGNRLGTLPFLVIGATSAVLYVVFSVRMSRAYNRQMLSTLRERVYLPERGAIESLGEGDVELLREVARGIESESAEVRKGYIGMLISANPSMAAEMLVPRLTDFEAPLQDQIIRALSAEELPELAARLEGCLDSGDAHLRATVLRYFVEHEDSSWKERLIEAMDDSNPRIRSVGVYGMLRLAPGEQGGRARDVWRSLLRSADPNTNLAGLDLLCWFPDSEFREEVLALLGRSEARLQHAALAALEQWPEMQVAGLEDSLTGLMDSPDYAIRARAVKCAVLLPYAKRVALVHGALEDDHPSVRESAVSVFVQGGEEPADVLGAAILENRFTPRTQAALLAELLKCVPQRSFVMDIAEAKAEEAVDFLNMRQWVLSQSREQPAAAAGEMLQFLLDERLQQVFELVLLALELIEDAEMICVIRSGLKSGDKRHRARAAEVLGNIADQKLARTLGVIIEGLYARQSAVIGEPGDRRFSWRELLEWCQRRNDPWLLQCFGLAARQLGGVGV